MQSSASSIPYERWIGNILVAVKAIANREEQEKRWPNPRFPWEQPNELVNSLFNDCLFEEFVQSQRRRFSGEEKTSADDLLCQLRTFLAATPNSLDPIATLSDPRWQSIRESAMRFVATFTGPIP